MSLARLLGRNDAVRNWPSRRLLAGTTILLPGINSFSPKYMARKAATMLRVFSSKLLSVRRSSEISKLGSRISMLESHTSFASEQNSLPCCTMEPSASLMAYEDAAPASRGDICADKAEGILTREEASFWSFDMLMVFHPMVVRTDASTAYAPAAYTHTHTHTANNKL